MKITFLGTSAGESYPAVWCDCPNCTYARVHGGRNIRMNTGSMIDDDVLLDMNNCSFHTAARLGVSLTGVKHLLVTHPHPDHLSIEPLAWREEMNHAVSLPEQMRIAAVSPRFTPLPVMTVYGNACVKETLLGARSELFDGSLPTQLRFQEIHEGERVETENMTFTPVRALHGKPGFAHSYIIERGGKTLLYALDAGGYEPDMMAIILSKRYDAVVSEGTFGLSPMPNEGHMNRDKNRAFRRLLLQKGCIAEETPFFLTHLAPHWTPPYDEYAPMMAKEGFTVAYDGMTAEI